MESCIFLAFVIFIIIVSSSNKKTSDNSSTNSSINLDELFNSITNTSGNNNTSLNQYNQKRSNRGNTSNSVRKQMISRNTLTEPSTHNDHDCEEVNYDQLDSLMGGIGSFNLSSQEHEVVDYYQEQPKIKIEREDLLKSFIMSEVLQKYDINRIYNRIPSIKSDD